MSKPIIAMLCAVTDNEGVFELKLQNAYCDAVLNAGGIPIVLPFTTDRAALHSYVNVCDGFLFTGGNDINPSLYGEEKSDFCGKIEDLRDEFELAVAKAAFPSGKPMLGICRGAQVLNVALGGTLYQDIDSEIPSYISHRQAEAKNLPSHSVSVAAGTPLYKLTRVSKMTANSFHQAIKKLGRGLLAMAYADDGIIEAVYSTEHPYLYAYQWHPERLISSDAHNRMLFSDFIMACASNSDKT